MRCRTGRARTGSVALLLVAAALVSGAPPARAETPRVGVLIVDHGEPPEYNELTYESFREFFDHLIEMGLIPSWLKLLETGTIAVDLRCPFCDEPSADPKLMDAWLGRHDGPGIFVPASDSLPAHYIVPGGPGLGEPDIFEHVGLGAWHEWELMGGRSPNYDQKLPKKLAAIRQLDGRYGDDVPVRVGYGIDPRINGGRQDIRKAVAGLINRERVDRIVVAYHGVGFSDIMQTHMIRHEVEEIAASMDPDVTLSYAKPLGTTDEYVRAVVNKAKSELARAPQGARVAIHLSGHGLPTGMCGDYDCGADAYHRSSKQLFERTRAALLQEIDGDAPGIFHIYGDGATDEDDPDNKVDSPIEALAERKEQGYDYVIDIPYEFDSDSRDTLIVLRRGYERPIPDWNRRLESSFTRDGIRVRITNCSYGEALKTSALAEVIFDEVERALSGTGSGDHDH